MEPEEWNPREWDPRGFLIPQGERWKTQDRIRFVQMLFPQNWEEEWNAQQEQFDKLPEHKRENWWFSKYGGEGIKNEQLHQLALKKTLGRVFNQLMYCYQIIGAPSFFQVFGVVPTSLLKIWELAKKLLQQATMPFDILLFRNTDVAAPYPIWQANALQEYTPIGTALPMAAFDDTSSLQEESVRRGYTDIANLSTTQRRKILTSMFGQSLTVTQISALVHDVYLSQIFLILWEQDPNQSATTLLQWAIQVQANSIMGQSKMALQMQLGPSNQELREILENPNEAQRNVLLWRWRRRNRSGPAMASFDQTAIDPGLNQGAFGPTQVDPDWATNLQQTYVGLDAMQSYQLAINRAAAQAWNYLQRMAGRFAWAPGQPLTPEENWRVAMRAPQRLPPGSQLDGWDQRERVHEDVNREVANFKRQRAREIEAQQVQERKRMITKRLGPSFTLLGPPAIRQMGLNERLMQALEQIAQHFDNITLAEAKLIFNTVNKILSDSPPEEWDDLLYLLITRLRKMRAEAGRAAKILPREDHDNDQGGYVGTTPLKASINWM